jgi:hypothetical protein
MMMTHERISDIQWSYAHVYAGGTVPYDFEHAFDEKNMTSVAIISHCDAHLRNERLAQLNQEHLDMHLMGGSYCEFHNRSLVPECKHNKLHDYNHCFGALGSW